MSRRIYPQELPTERWAVDTETGGPTSPRTKSLGLVPPEEAAAHRRAQQAARAHDAGIEGLRTSRAARDRDRVYPRSGIQTLPGRRGRRLQDPDALRLPVSRNQTRRLNRATAQAAERMPQTERRAVQRLVHDEQHWDDLNQALADLGRGQGELTAAQAREVHRVDRAIRRAEQHNDRHQVVYAGLAVDPELAGQLASLPPGTRFTFDQYTVTDHNPHNIPADVPLLEIEGQAGMYLGNSNPSGETTHLLPRGCTITVVRVADTDVAAPGQGPAGITRRRLVQARITNSEETP